jgi:hypothetical protein
MKKVYIAILMALIAGVSCKKGIELDKTVLLPTDMLFEDLQVGRFSHVIPATDFKSSIATFNVENEGNDWSGFAISSRNLRNFVKLATSVDSTRFSVYTVQPNAGGNFLVVRPKGENAAMTLSKPMEIDKILVANTTQVWQVITYGIGNATVGNTYAPGTTIMNTTRKDYLKIIIKGYLGSTATGTVEFLLADRRSDALLRTITVTDWMPVSLAALGKVDKVVFNLESTDKTAGVMNTPNYFCLDGIRFKENIN